MFRRLLDLCKIEPFPKQKEKLEVKHTSFQKSCTDTHGQFKADFYEWKIESYTASYYLKLCSKYVLDMEYKELDDQISSLSPNISRVC